MTSHNHGQNGKTRQCGSDAQPKTKHKSRAGAVRAMLRRIEAGAYAPKLNVYPCRWCGSFHVGTRWPEEVRARRHGRRSAR